jgi:TRADD-N domain-containing protein
MATTSPVEKMKTACKDLEQIKTEETQKLAAALWQINIEYYEDVRRRSSKSFYLALGAAIVGTGFFVFALRSMMRNQIPFSQLSLIAGATIQVISGISFYLYGKSSHQFSAFHACLERSNRFLLANSICENLEPPDKSEMRKELIGIIANAHILSEDYVKHGD